MKNSIPMIALAFVCAVSMIASGCDVSSSADASNDEIPSAQCELRLELPTTFKADELGVAKVSIKNMGQRTITLVKPGDGSDCHWRTPIVGWSFLPVDSKDLHPKDPPRRGGARCGNINALCSDEVFVLKPGESKGLTECVSLTHRLTPGNYRVVFYYTNVPDLTWSGLPLRDHDAGAMRRLKASTPISLVSNEVQVEVTE